MSTPTLLTDAQRTRFDQDGLLVLPGFYDRERDIAPVQRGIHAVIGQVMRRHGMHHPRDEQGDDGFDDGYLSLIAADRSRGGEVYDAIKQLPAFVRLLADARHEKLFRELRPGAVPGIAAGGFGIRIDNPGEDRYRALWHQEYPAQLRSIDGLVFWSTLRPVTEDR